MAIPRTNLFKGDRVRLSQRFINMLAILNDNTCSRYNEMNSTRVGTIITDTLQKYADAIAVLWDGNTHSNRKHLYHPDDLVLVEEEPVWTEPKYPGDTVRQQLLKRTDKFGSELGMIIIQHYTNSVLVASFLPGEEIILPGDTPKVEPECSRWCTSSYRADDVFDHYVMLAYKGGWQVDYEAERIRK